MKKIVLAGIIFLFVVSGSYAQPGYKPLPQQQRNYQQYQQQRQQQNWDSMQRQNEQNRQNRETERRELEESFEQIDRDIKGIYEK